MSQGHLITKKRALLDDDDPNDPDYVEEGASPEPQAPTVKRARQANTDDAQNVDTTPAPKGGKVGNGNKGKAAKGRKTKAKGSKGRKNEGEGEGDEPGKEGNRRKSMSLREQLINKGCVTPRPATHPIRSVVRSKRRGKPVRQFLIPAEDGENTENGAPARSKESEDDDEDTRAIKARVNNTKTGVQPKVGELASKNTPFDQLYYPQSLRLTVKANEHKWNDKQGAKAGDKTVFVILHQVRDEVTDVRVFDSPKDANANVLEIMAKMHPSAFAAVPPSSEQTPANDGADQSRTKVKEEEPERASDVLRQIQAKPNARTKEVLRIDSTDAGDATVSKEAHVTLRNEESDGGGGGGRSTREQEEEEEESLFLTDRAAADTETSRYESSAFGVDGAATATATATAHGAEKKFVYWGGWKVGSYGLKMEAKHKDGTVVKVSTSMKRLRK